MSTTSTVITIIICFLLVAASGLALVKGIWSAAKKITVPLQIVLFVVMLVCVVRLFCTKENAKKLYDGIEQTGISQNMENTMRTALKMKPAEVSKPVAKPVQVATASTVAEPAVARAESESVQTPAPAVVDVEVKASPVSQPAVKPESVPVMAHDYSHLDKGKKSFAYALPVSATVTVGFKDNTYRVISESIGHLNATEKKEVGKLIFTSLGKYVGKTIEGWDKAKISIDSRYDESDDRTRVFVTIPPDAID